MKKVVCSILVGILSIHAYAQDAEFTRLCNFMSGSFSSNQQSVMDSDYYDIRLHMVPIWEERTDGFWLYVEQALASIQEKPYRQRIYKVHVLHNTTFESVVYEMNEPLQYAGAWNDRSKLDKLSPDNLILREGCSIILHWNDAGFFEGKTADNTCPSNLRGAAYATSEVKIYGDTLISWDRGFDTNGKQVWGAEKGGYIFNKVHE
ncbi:MAG: chromophore lyase CpcT/CpeT [Chitinophagales bacterium]